MKHIKIFKNLIILTLITALLCVFCSCSVTFSSTNTAKADTVVNTLDYNIRPCYYEKVSNSYDAFIYDNVENENPENLTGFEYSLYNVEQHATSSLYYDDNNITIVNKNSYFVFGDDFYSLSSFAIVLKYGIAENSSVWYDAYLVVYISDLEAITDENGRVYCVVLLNGVNFAPNIWFPDYDNMRFIDFRYIDFYAEEDYSRFGIIPTFNLVHTQTGNTVTNAYFKPTQLLINSQINDNYKYKSSNIVMLCDTLTAANNISTLNFQYFSNKNLVLNVPAFDWGSNDKIYIRDNLNDQIEFSDTATQSEQTKILKNQIKLYIDVGLGENSLGLPMSDWGPEVNLNLYCGILIESQIVENVIIEEEEENSSSSEIGLTDKGVETLAGIVYWVGGIITFFIPQLVHYIQYKSNHPNATINDAYKNAIENAKDSMRKIILWVSDIIQTVRNSIVEIIENIKETLNETKNKVVKIGFIALLGLTLLGFLTLYLKFYGED